MVGNAHPEVQALFHLLEKSFAPLTLVQQSQKGLTFLAGNAKLKAYVKPLKNLIVVKLLRQLSQVRESVGVSGSVRGGRGYW